MLFLCPPRTLLLSPFQIRLTGKSAAVVQQQKVNRLSVSYWKSGADDRT